MKTLRKIAIAAAFVLTTGAFANNVKVVSGNDGEVTITENNEMVQVSILNVDQLTYTLFLYNEDGDLLYKGAMGNGQSLGKTFDFQDAQNGNYKFKVVSSNGETSTYRVHAGTGI